MFKRFLFFLIILLLPTADPLFAKKILFSPIPNLPKETLLNEYHPLIKLIQEKTGLPVEFHYERDYRELVSAFKAGKIAIITAGPLPYYLLKKEYPPARPILHLREKDGSIRYACVLFTAHDGPRTPGEIKGKIALPQRLSTCGPFSAGVILLKYGKDINKLGYLNFDTHDAVVEAVIRGKVQAGVVKRDVAEKYKGFAIRVLDKSPEWPAFAIIVNTQILTKEEIEKIKTALLNISPDEAKKLIVGKYGFAEADEKDFEIIGRYERFIPSF